MLTLKYDANKFVNKFVNKCKSNILSVNLTLKITRNVCGDSIVALRKDYICALDNYFTFQRFVIVRTDLPAELQAYTVCLSVDFYLCRINCASS